MHSTAMGNNEYKFFPHLKAWRLTLFNQITHHPGVVLPQEIICINADIASPDRHLPHPAERDT